MATFLELTDSPSGYGGKALKFVRVNAGENALSIAGVELSDLTDVNASGGYAPTDTQILQYSAAAGEWRPLANDPYSAGNGLNKSAQTFNVVGGTGLTADGTDVHITDTAVTPGTYGNATYSSVVTVNQQGQVTSASAVEIVSAAAATLTADYVETVVGTSGQITVTGGTGNKSTATLNLVATGVTSGTYGNATTVPQITVDTYGRVQNVDLINLSGGGGGSGGNVELAFKTFAVTGQTSVSADGTSDTLNLAGGAGIDVTTNAGTDTITISTNTFDIGNSLTTDKLNNISTTAPTNNQVLKYDSASSKYVPFTLTDATGIALTDLSGSTGITYNNSTGAIALTNSGVTAKTYGNTSVIPQITVNAQGQITAVSNVSIDGASGVTAGTYGTATSMPQFVVNSAGKITSVANVSIAASTQTLSWNAATDEIGISGGNTIDITSIRTNSFQTVAVSGQTNVVADNDTDTLNFAAGSGITLTTDTGTDTITITNSGSSGTASVVSLTDTTINSPTNGQVLKYNGTKWVNAADAGGSGTLLSLTDVGSDGTNGQVLTTNGAGAFTFTSVAGSYGDSNVGTYLSAQGYASQATIVAAITDSAPGTLDTLNELAAALGDDANFSTTITNSIATKAAISSLSTVGTSGLFTDLTSRPAITLSGSNFTYDGTTLDLSGLGATGATGAAGAAGSTGAAGAAGSTGAAGNGVTNVRIVSDALEFTYANSSVQNLGDVKGATGATGAAGAAGAAGADGGGAALTDFSVTTGSASGGGTLAYNNGTGVTTFAPADLSSYLTSETFTSVAQDTTPQLGGDLDLNGKDIVTISNGDIDLDPNGTGKVVFRGNVTKGSGQFKLNCENNSHGVTIKGPAHAAAANYTLTLPTTDGDADQVLRTDGSGVLSWVANSGGGGGGDITAVLSGTGMTGGASTGSVTLSLADTSVTAGTYGSATVSPEIVVDAQGRITSVTNRTISGGGGSGAKNLRFKLNYDSSGNLTSTSNLSTGISSATIDSASGGDMTITFDSGTYNYPPASVMIYGYDYTNNKYLLSQLSTTMGLREIAGGGSSGSPTFFDGSSAVQVKLRLREAETGASRSFGTTTHAWMQFVMYD